MREKIIVKYNKELNNLHKECEEEGYELFDDVAKDNAKKILEFLCNKFSKYDYDIYPDFGREINIECCIEPEGRILISCDSEGGVTYFRSFNGEIDDHRYQNINSFNFDQLYEAFKSFESLNGELSPSSNGQTVK